MATISSLEQAAPEAHPVSTPATTVGGVMQRRMPSPRKVFAISSLGVFIAFVDATIVNIAFPDIQRSFPEAGISTLSWVLSGYNIVFAAFLVAAGRLADLVGRKRTFVWGLALFTLASGLCAAAPSAEALIAARLVQALGAAVLIPSSLGLVLESFSHEHRAHAVALSTAVGALAAGIGPPLGGLLVTVSDWRLVFLVNIPIGLVAIVLGRRHLVESRAPGRRRLPDLLGSVLFAFSIGLLVLGVIKGPDWGWTDWRVLAAWAASLALGAVVVQRCRTHRSPIIDLTLLRIRAFTVANLATILAAAGFFGYTLVNVLFLTSVWQYSILDAGLALVPGPFVAAAVAAPTSRLVERYGARPILVAGGLVWGGAVMWMVNEVGTTPDFVSEWLPGMILLGIGAGMLLANVSGAAIAAAPGRSFGTATGLNSVARQVGAALGIAVVVAVIGDPSPAQAPAAFDDAWTFAALSLFAAGLVCLAIGRVGTAEGGTDMPSLAAAAREMMREPTREERPPLPALAPHERHHVPAPESHHRAESVADFLGQVPLFAGLRGKLRERLAVDARVVHLAAGEWLFREGEDADCLFVVRAGRLEIVAEGPDATVLRVLGRGDALGELALLTDSPRSASVRAARDSDLIAIDRAPFEALLDEAPELSRSVSTSLAQQLRASRGAVETKRPRPTTVALLPLSEGVRVHEVAAGLAAALTAYGAVATLDDTVAPRRESAAEALAAYGPALDRAEAIERRGRARRRRARRRGPVDRLLPPAGRSAALPDARRRDPRRRAAPAGAARLRPRRRRRRARLRRARRLGRAARTGRDARAAAHRVRRRARAHGAAPDRQLGRRRVLGRRRARPVAHRRDRGAARVRRPDRPRRRGQHGRLHRRHARRGDGARGDRRALLRGVGPQAAALGLHAAAPLADPRRSRRGDARAHVRHACDRGAGARLLQRQRGAAQRLARRPSLGAASWIAWGRASRCRSSARRSGAAVRSWSTARWSTTCPSRRWPRSARGL